MYIYLGQLLSIRNFILLTKVKQNLLKCLYCCDSLRRMLFVHKFDKISQDSPLYILGGNILFFPKYYISFFKYLRIFVIVKSVDPVEMLYNAFIRKADNRILFVVYPTILTIYFIGWESLFAMILLNL